MEGLKIVVITWMGFVFIKNESHPSYLTGEQIGELFCCLVFLSNTFYGHKTKFYMFSVSQRKKSHSFVQKIIELLTVKFAFIIHISSGLSSGFLVYRYIFYRF